MKQLFSILLAVPLLLSGCATVSDSPLQQLELHAVLDYQEVGGVGCILSNDMGRWFVVAPGRVTVTRSTKPLTVSCKKDGAGVAQESVGSRADMAGLMGNVVISAGVGMLVDRYTGAGYSYPANLTVLMAPLPSKDALAASQRVDSPVF
ncbi:hypothetical protein LK542_13065 [Massilia sp. IC2-477]|uniref:hypothetical protein n=1 Tax=unclassified Massilia TaxID=2609279 RepID=UPI001D128AE2|nr:MULTISPECIES: hypothetical protein [unclassified Massilia]MCC2956545.1 hypothetical protein [Massilia sp. IC2-477]MCC2972091.1 hypothetical protein [Massilia sp. IC2-476]